MTETVHSGTLTNRVIGDPEMRRLLVVDDEETIRLALGKFLRTRGYEVQTAESGVAALEALQNARFSLMLCDIRMPGMTGLECPRRV
jgi:CheY-like chemotaxis protein